jgi:hypothetical protein
LFEPDAFGADVMLGACPEPKTAEACNQVFDRTAALLREAALYSRPMGRGQFVRISLVHVARGVYSAKLPQASSGDASLEYYIQVVPEEGEPVVFPATAPAINQTVVRVDSRRGADGPSARRSGGNLLGTRGQAVRAPSARIMNPP